MKKIALFILFTLFLSAKITIASSIAPQSFLIEQIAKDKANIITIVKPKHSPHTYEPKPSLMKKISSADGYFAIGVEFEKVWLKKFRNQNPNLKIFYIDNNITKINNDPHIWLDPINLIKISTNIANSLIKLNPSNKEFYLNNLKVLHLKLNKLHQTINNKLKTLTNRNFLVFHPSWSYYAKRYNLNQIPIEVEGSKPSIKELINILNKAKTKHIKIIFTQPEFSLKEAFLIAKELNIKLTPISPLKKDLINNLLFITNKIAKANSETN